MMKNEAKICLPVYKMIYAVIYMGALSLVRGIAASADIGMLLECDIIPMVLIFCADTYEQEYGKKRWEVFYRFPLKNKAAVIRKRFCIQWGFLFALTAAGYWLFFWQQPQLQEGVSEWTLYLISMAAVWGSIIFWSVFAVTLVGLLNNYWAGTGVAAIIWLILSSKAGEEIPEGINVFAFHFRDLGNAGDYSWVPGKIMALLVSGALILGIPYLIKRKEKLRYGN